MEELNKKICKELDEYFKWRLVHTFSNDDNDEVFADKIIRICHGTYEDYREAK